MAADTSKITVVCPTCDNKMEIPGEKKNTRLECPKCGIAICCEWEMDENKWQNWRKFIR